VPTQAGQLEHLDRLGESLDRHLAQRLDLDIALGKPERLGAEQRGSRPRELLDTRGQMRRLPHRGVVHVQVAPD